MQILYKELTKTASSLTINITASNEHTHALPWKFVFDFDMNGRLSAAAFGRLRGTCMIFSADEPAEHLKIGQGLDTPERALKWDKRLKANAFCPLATGRAETMKYDKVELWRLAAVGFRTAATGFAV